MLSTDFFPYNIAVFWRYPIKGLPLTKAFIALPDDTPNIRRCLSHAESGRAFPPNITPFLHVDFLLLDFVVEAEK